MADNWVTKCNCGSMDCRKLIAKNANLPGELKEKYEACSPDWIKKNLPEV